MTIRDRFNLISKHVTNWTGGPWAFAIAVLAIIVWVFYAAPYGFDGNSQMPVNTCTTIVTFLMVFLIQTAQNRDNKALHVKLDELLLKMKEADNKIIEAQDMTDDEIDALDRSIKEKAREESVEQVNDKVNKVDEKVDRVNGKVEEVKQAVTGY